MSGKNQWINLSDPKLTLNALIVSGTQFTSLLNVSCKQEDLEEKSVLFMSDGGPVYLKKMFERIVVPAEFELPSVFRLPKVEVHATSFLMLLADPIIQERELARVHVFPSPSCLTLVFSVSNRDEFHVAIDQLLGHRQPKQFVACMLGKRGGVEFPAVIWADDLREIF